MEPEQAVVLGIFFMCPKDKRKILAPMGFFSFITFEAILGPKIELEIDPCPACDEVHAIDVTGE